MLGLEPERPGAGLGHVEGFKFRVAESESVFGFVFKLPASFTVEDLIGRLGVSGNFFGLQM